VGALVTLAM
jgi:hypothetical protein